MSKLYIEREAVEQALSALVKSVPVILGWKQAHQAAVEELRAALYAAAEPEANRLTDTKSWAERLRFAFGHLSSPAPAAPDAAKPEFVEDWQQSHPPTRHCMCPDCIPSFDDRFEPRAAKPEPCAGMNCGATDGVSHSPECYAEHAASIAGGVFVKVAKSETQGERAYVDRSEAVNLARNILDEDSDPTPEGIRILCDAIMRMDAALLSAGPARV